MACANCGAIPGQAFFPTETPMRSASAIASAISAVWLTCNAETESTCRRSAPSRETASTTYRLWALSVSTSFSSMSMNTTRYPLRENTCPMKDRPIFPAPHWTNRGFTLLLPPIHGMHVPPVPAIGPFRPAAVHGRSLHGTYRRTRRMPHPTRTSPPYRYPSP